MAVPVNWSQVLTRCRPEIRKKIMDVRGRHEELRRLIAESQASMPKIDFAKYRAALPAGSRQLVDEFESKVNAFKVQAMDTAPLFQALESERTTKVTEAQKFLEELELDIAKAKHKLAVLKEAKPADELTPDDVYDVRPELKSSFEEALSADNWSTSAEDKDATDKASAAH